MCKNATFLRVGKLRAMMVYNSFGSLDSARIPPHVSRTKALRTHDERNDSINNCKQKTASCKHVSYRAEIDTCASAKKLMVKSNGENTLTCVANGDSHPQCHGETFTLPCQSAQSCRFTLFTLAPRQIAIHKMNSRI